MFELSIVNGPPVVDPFHNAHNLSFLSSLSYEVHLWLGLGESSFLRLEYFIELLIEYSNIRLISEVAINYRVLQSKGHLVPHLSV